MNYFLGVDAGGTKSTTVIIDENSKIVAEVKGGPANYHNIGLTQTVANITQTIQDVLHKANLKLADITWCTLGVASCDTEKDYRTLLKGFTTGLLLPIKDTLTMVNDTKIGLYSGTLPPGVVVICGTGCNVYGKNAHGQGIMAGNWGNFLGDKGSGYHIGKRMFEAVVDAYQETGDPTLLMNKLEAKINARSPQDILDWYNDTKPSVHEVSDFAPLVIQAAEEGDEVAKQIIDKAIAELGKALTSVVRRLKMENEYNRVVIVGGLFESKYFRAVFEGHATALLKRVRVVKPLVSAAVGAAIMAKHQWEQKQKSDQAAK